MTKHKTACRRCSDCVGMSHHWMDNGDFGRDPSEVDPELGERTDCDYLCKHCPAAGNECPVCDGSGEGFSDDDSMCPTCKGEGVILLAE